MKSILSIKKWKNGKFSKTYEDTDLKTLEDIAGKLHTEVESINRQTKSIHYSLHTSINGSRKKSYYKLHIKARFYHDKSKHEHKENTHRQKIHI